MIHRILFLALLLFAASLAPITTSEDRAAGVFNALQMSQAQARSRRRSVRRTVRRTARRTARRVARRTSVANCVFRAPYYYCSGVYYRPIVENGVTVYIVVNP